MSWPIWAALLAVLPIALLGALVLRSQPLTRTAWTCAGAAAVLAVTVFGLSLTELGVALARGAWTGIWILLIVLPALLLYQVLDRSGALEQLADAADAVAPTEGRRLLLLAWILPSFLQGAAGFGAPIAMTAPMLVRRGMAPIAAVAACTIGYQWSVTFGSMGSSYFMAEATARLSPSDARSFAVRAAAMLAVTALVSGLLVLSRGRRSPGDLWRTFALGAVMGVALILAVSQQPALGSTAAGLAGLLAAWVLLPGRDAARPRGANLLAAAAPYVALTLSITVVYVFTPLRTMAERVPAIAPTLQGSSAAFGYSSETSPLSPAFRPLLHPLVWVLFAIVVAVVVYRRRGWWPAGSTGAAVRAWLPRCRSVGSSILGLTVFAGILTEAGMIAAVADALARGLGLGFLAVSSPLGSLGTILTGSTTASNALFAPLQAQVATTLALLPAILLTGQTAGGNIGNAIAPSVATVGANAVGVPGREGEILRRNLGGAALLTVLVVVGLLVQLWLLPG